MYGRSLITERKYISLTPEQRDFLVTGCWCIGSQESGFLPPPEDIAFKIRINVKTVEKHLAFLLEHDWLKEYTQEEYEETMSILNAQVEDNKSKKKKEPRDANDLKREAKQLGYEHLIKRI